MKYLAVTGFYATGSSAVIDLLNGHPDFSESTKDPYEHVILYNPGSIFDLEWKLLYNNDLHRSDEAIKTFIKEMDRLKQNFGWFGSFNNMFGDKFDKIEENYVNSLIEYKHGLISYKDYKKVRFSLIKMIAQIGARILKKRKIYKYGRQYVYYKDSKVQFYSNPSKEKFFEESQKFVSSYASLFEQGDKKIVFDHLVLPNHLNRIDNYFTDDFKFIVVNRDPRDLFALSKYIYQSKNPFPLDVNQFCDFYLKQQACLKENKRILKVQFEDLIYQLDKTKKEIFDFCEVKDAEYQSQLFPEKSINNTQTFRLNGKWNEEVKVIEERLKDYLYKFPYERTPELKETFE